MPRSASAGKIARSGDAAHQRVLDLQVADRVHRRGPSDRLDADLREADVADVAGLHHVGDRADRLLDRHRGIEARRTVDVDVVDAEAREAVGEEVLRRGGAGVVAEIGAVGPAQAAELHAEQGPVAAGPGQRLADEELVLPHRIEVAGVDEVHAGVERRVDGGDPLRLVAAAVQLPAPIPMQPSASGNTWGPAARASSWLWSLWFAWAQSGPGPHMNPVNRIYGTHAQHSWTRFRARSRSQPAAGLRGGGGDRQRHRGGEAPLPHAAGGQRGAAAPDHRGGRAAVPAQRPRPRAHQSGRAAARRPGGAPRPARRGRARAGDVRSGDERAHAAARPLRLGRALGLAAPAARARARGAAHADRRRPGAVPHRRRRARLRAGRGDHRRRRAARDDPARALFYGGFTCLFDPRHAKLRRR